MILIDNHIEHESDTKLELGKVKIDSVDTKYRVLYIGELANYLSLDQVEELCDEIDTTIHIETETNEWMKARIEKLESKVSDLEGALEEVNECDNHNNFDGEQDFYERI